MYQRKPYGVDKVRLLNYNRYVDYRGCLCPIDFEDIPFKVKRIFYVNEVPDGEIRGKHGHKKERHVIVCLQGFIEVLLYDGNRNKVCVIGKGMGIYVPNMIWGTQKFYNNATMLVLSSNKYDPKDYFYEPEYINECFANRSWGIHWFSLSKIFSKKD